jgi:hypothetical protein
MAEVEEWETLASRVLSMSVSFRREREHWVAAHRRSNEVAEVYKRVTHTRLHACA